MVPLTSGEPKRRLTKMRFLIGMVAGSLLFAALTVPAFLLLGGSSLLSEQPFRTGQATMSATTLAAGIPEAVLSSSSSEPRTPAELGRDRASLDAELKKLDRALDTAMNGTSVALRGVGATRPEEDWTRRFDRLYEERSQVLKQIADLDQRHAEMLAATPPAASVLAAPSSPQPLPLGPEESADFPQAAAAQDATVPARDTVLPSDTAPLPGNAGHVALEAREEALRIAIGKILDKVVGKAGEGEGAPPGLTQKDIEEFQQLNEERNRILERLAQVTGPMPSPDPRTAAELSPAPPDATAPAPQVTDSTAVDAATSPPQSGESAASISPASPSEPPVAQAMLPDPSGTRGVPEDPPSALLRSPPPRPAGPGLLTPLASAPVASSPATVLPPLAPPSSDGNGTAATLGKPAVTVLVPRARESEQKLRCRALIQRAQLGEDLSLEERSFLRRGCAV